MKVAVYGRSFGEKFIDSIKLFFKTLKDRDIDIVVYNDFLIYLNESAGIDTGITDVFISHKDLDDSYDFLFSIGGDGTYLESVAFVRYSNIPIIGINSGRLGFLADISQTEIPDALESVFKKEYFLGFRTLLELKSDKKLFGEMNYALNEVTLHKRDSSSMIKISAYLDDILLNTYWADGLMVSTPTGSTAYSLSVGGPIVTPNSNNFIIAPIAPHNLSVRPLIIPDNVNIRLKVEGENISCLAALDFRSAEFDSGLEFHIKKADFTVKTVTFSKNSFYNTLRNKLMWGYDKRN
jgi:NAD+ kinase